MKWIGWKHEDSLLFSAANVRSQLRVTAHEVCSQGHTCDGHKIHEHKVDSVINENKTTMRISTGRP